MKKCPFCAEAIQSDAVKCRFCNEFLEMRPKAQEEARPWYFRTGTVVAAVLCLLALALPLVWFNPYYNRRNKIMVTLAVLFLTYLTWLVTAQAFKSMDEYYKLLM